MYRSTAYFLRGLRPVVKVVNNREKSQPSNRTLMYTNGQLKLFMEQRVTPSRMSSSLSASSTLPSDEKPVEVLWGCELSSSMRTCVVKTEDNLMEQIVFLKSVSLGEEAEDGLHVVAVESKNMTSVCKPVPIASLQRSVLPMVSLGNFEFTPPVAFVLKSGTGPVYLVGQHLICDLEGDYQSPGLDTQMDDSQMDMDDQMEGAPVNVDYTQVNENPGESNAGTEDYPGGAPEAPGEHRISKRQPFRI